MTVARSSLIDVSVTEYYHCMSRCVRKAFLCGYDKDRKRSLEHRRQWVLDRIKQLSTSFAIDVCAYALMSNHYHLVLRVHPEEAKSWKPEEVEERWSQQFPHSKPESLDRHEQIEIWREKLGSISWFMKALNEHISRKANKEDGCTGRFWEGRFKSQALLDQTALLTCMAYVDLNPVRAGIAETPELSDFTSIQERIQLLQPPSEEVYVSEETEVAQKALFSFYNKDIPPNQRFPFQLTVEEYLQLVDLSGRTLRSDKKGHIDENLLPILTRLQVNPAGWMKSMQNFEKQFYKAAGPLDRLRATGKRWKQKFICGLPAAKELYPQNHSTKKN